MKPINIILSCLALFLVGCSTTPHGIINPPPNGCIHLEYFSLSDTSKVERNAEGEISHVVTATGRVEKLIKKWELDDFEKVIFEKGNFEKEEAVRQHSEKHPEFPTIILPRGDDDLRIPGLNVWQEVKKHLKPSDEIWTFGFWDAGTVIIRDGHLFCMAVVTHQF